MIVYLITSLSIYQGCSGDERELANHLGGAVSPGRFDLVILACLCVCLCVKCGFCV